MKRRKSELRRQGLVKPTIVNIRISKDSHELLTKLKLSNNDTLDAVIKRLVYALQKSWGSDLALIRVKLAEVEAERLKNQLRGEHGHETTS